MPSRRLAVPFALLAALFIYLAYEIDEAYTIGIVITVLILVLFYVFAPQINWWYWQRHPPELPPSLRALVERTPFYQRLTEADKAVFRQRVYLFNHSNVFMPQAIKEVTDDIKTAISTAAVQVTMHRETFRFPEYETIIVYAHPFPSPRFPDHLHASEVFDDEHGNGLIFSVEHVMRSFLQPQQYYNVGLHEYAQLLIKTSPEYHFPRLDEVHWPVLEKISGFPHQKLLEYIGLDEIDILPVAIAHYFVFPARFQQQLPEVFAELEGIFFPALAARIDPL